MTLILILILLATIPAVGFPIVYGLTSTWYKTTLGRALMLSGVSMGIVMCLVLFTAVHGPDYPGREYVRVGVYLLIVVFLWTKFLSYTATVLKIRRTKRKENQSVSEG